MEKEEVFSKIYNNYINNRMSHVVLLETNDTDKCFFDLLKVCKKILCKNEYKENCNICNICYQIDSGYYPDLQIIESEKNLIKKESIINLQHFFTTKSFNNNPRLYIIKDADKMNVSSSNSLLKFIEEPSEKIIGFFITTNKEKILPTILSRCEKYNIIYANPTINITLDDKQKIDDIISKLEIEISKRSLVKLFLLKKNLIDILDDKQKVLYFFITFYYIYFDNIKNKKYNDDELLIAIKKMKIIDKIIKNLNYNVNLDLLIDKFFVEMVE